MIQAWSPVSCTPEEKKLHNYYNFGTKEMLKLHAGDNVRIRPFVKEKSWTKTQVRDQEEIRSNEVGTEEGVYKDLRLREPFSK